MSQPLIIHCGYHKCLTVYFYRVFRQLADERRLKLQYFLTGEAIRYDADIILFPHSEAQPDWLRQQAGRIRGTHVIRDPRDLLVSAYFYHLRTDEEWCAQPNPRHINIPQDKSYQQCLQALDQEQGLIFELDRVSGGEIRAMRDWNYHNRNILELRFEDIVGNERASFTEIFQWYGFEGQSLETAVDIAIGLALDNVAEGDKGLKHARKGSKAGQWQDFFTPRISGIFKRRYGQVLIDLGYATDNNW